MSEISFELASLASEGSAIDRLAHSLVAEGADDVTQEAFLAYLERPEAVRETLGQFLSGTVKRLVSNRHRADRRRTSREKAAARRESVEPSAAWVERIERRKIVADAVIGLLPGDREIVILRYFEGLAPREIARRLGLGNDVVRSRLSRALARLREHLDRTHGDDRTAWTSLLLPLAASGVRPIGLRELFAMKVKMKLVAPLVLLCIVFGGVVGLWRSEADPSDIANLPVQAVESPRIEPRRETASVPEPTVTDRDQVSRTPAEPATMNENSSLGPAVEVLVVDAVGDTPIADAEVVLLNRFEAITDPSISYRRIVESEIARLGAMDVSKKFGKKFKTDRFGRVTIPGVPPMSEISASSARKFGSLDFFGDIPPSATIRIAESRRLTVRVVDGDDRPVANMPVVAGPSFGGMSMSGKPMFEPTVRGTTDAMGIARLEITGSAAEAVSIAAALDIAGGEATIELRPTADWKDEPIVLEKPTTTEVEITVLGTDGRPVADGAAVRLDEHRMVGEMKDFTTANSWALTKKGQVRFPFATAGIDLGISVVMPHGIPEDFMKKSPAKTGETARFEVKLGGRLIEATGHVSYTTGEDAVNLLFFVQAIDGPGRSPMMRPIVSDGIGNVKFKTLDFGSPTMFVVLGQAPDAGPLHRFTISPKADVRSVAIGDIVIPPPPFIVAGKVVDLDGQPIPNAEVNVMVDPRLGGPRHRPATTNAEGLFRIEGVLPPNSELAVTAAVAGFFQERPEKSTFGADDVTIILAPAIEVNGKILVDPKIDAREIGITLRRAGVARGSADGHPAATRADGRFGIKGLPKGTYDVFVDDGMDLHERAVLTNVAISDGATDARLEAIDLRGAFDLLTIVATDPNGVPIEPTIVARRDGKNLGTLRARGGRLLVARSLAADTLVASYGGADSITLPAKAGTYTLNFRAQRTLELVARPLWQSDEAGVTLLIEVTPIVDGPKSAPGGSSEPRHLAQPVVEAITGETTTVSISNAAQYSITYAVTVQSPRGPRHVAIEAPPTIVSGDASPVTLDLPSDAIAAAVAKAKN